MESKSLVAAIGAWENSEQRTVIELNFERELFDRRERRNFGFRWQKCVRQTISVSAEIWVCYFCYLVWYLDNFSK